ncbi:hypothetical protein AMK59_3921, partial [Oryctes borbonicus]
ILKICLNHTLTKDIIYTPKDDKTWLFSAPDFSEGEIQHKQFCIRFKSGVIAKDFRKAIDSALDEDNVSELATKSDDSDVEIVYETTVTPEEEEEAIRLGLPLKFMCYRQMDDCKCDECKKDDVLLKDILSPKPIPPKGSVSSITSPCSSIFTTPKSNSTVFSTPNLDSTKSIPSTISNSFVSIPGTPTESKKEETVKDLLIKPSIFNPPQPNATNKPTTSFSSPALVSAINNQSVLVRKPDEKVSTSAAALSVISGFSFTLKNDNQSSSSPTVFSPNIFGNKTPSTTGGSSIYSTPPSTSIFGGGNQTAASGLFANATSSGSGSIFGGGNTQTFGSSGSLFGGNKTATTTAAPVKGNIFGSPAITPQTSNQSIFSIGAPNLAGGDTSKAAIDSTVISSAIATSSEATPKGSLFSAPPSLGSITFGGSQGSVENKSFGSTPIFGSSQSKSVFGNATATLTFGSSATPSAAAPLDCSVGSSKLEEKKFNDFLKVDPNLNFASLAKGTNDTPTFAKDAGDDKTPFAFLGAGTPVFGGKKGEGAAKSKDDKDDSVIEEKSEVNTSTEEEYDPQYEPIVPLPDAVTVLTGEEDERVLFNERAKLFRYDVDLKEWKERGIGQLKILYHPSNHTYRLLLRREQVHKVVLNQLITPDFSLQPMSTNEKAWCWGGYNYSEDDHCLEKLAARFTSVELSRQFYKIIQTAIEAVKDYQTTQKMIPSTLAEYVVGDVNGADEGERDDVEEVEGEEEEEDLDYYDDDEDEDER